MTGRPHRFVLVLAVACAAAACSYFTRSQPEGPVIVVSIDTLRADRLPAYGYGRSKTPHIDRLVADGVLFENAYSHSPQTLPSHTSILSGQLPFEHGVRDNIGFNVARDQRFLQHAFNEHGFATGGFVSSYVLRRDTGFDRGFDTYDAELPAASPDRPLGEVQRPGTDTIARAIKWIDERTSPKFFQFVHIYEPHAPYSPPARFSANSYDGEVEYADEIVGQLLDHLRRKELYESATIVLLSDHGEGLGDHGEDEHGIFIYRSTVHVPLIVKLPARRGAGQRVSVPVQHIDLAPTLLDLAGANASASFRGRTLRPLLDRSGSIASAGIYSESMSPRYHFGWSELYALTDGRYRLIRAPRDELYDLSTDPGEHRSVDAERPQVRTGMRKALDEMVANAKVAPPSTAVTDEDRKRLAALGYVGTQSSAPLDLPGDRLPDPKDHIATLQKYKRATALTGEGRLDEAARLLRELLQDNPEMTDVWHQLADVYTRLGRIAEAVAAQREVIKRKPKDAAALTGAATGLVRLGRLDEARAHAELAIGVAPAAAHELLARIALEQNELVLARKEAALASTADPSLPMPSFVEGLIRYKHQDFPGAVQHLQQTKQALRTRTVQMPDVNYYLADSLARLERYAEAERAFQAELTLFPANARAMAGLAMLYRATGRVAESEKAIDDLMRASPTPEGFELAAQLWTMFGEPAKAAAVRARVQPLVRPNRR